MAVELKPSNLLNRAAGVVATGRQGTVHVTVQGHDVATDPLIECLRQAAAMHALYDGRGWPATRVDQRVSPADRAALRFAHALLGAQHHTDADLQPKDGVGRATPVLRDQGSE